MQQVSNKIIIFSGLLLSGFFWAGAVKAVCPLCVVAVGAGLGLSRWLGVDDVISSIWIGGLLVALSLWTIVWLKKRNWVFPYDGVVVFLAYYLLTLVTLYYADIAGHPLYKIFGIDKIIFGTVVGTIISVLAHWLNTYLKKKNNGKVFFPYQKVVIPLVLLILTSVVFYLLLTWRII